MSKQHTYNLTVQWTGNKGQGTTDYRSYERSHTVMAEGKPPIFGSADPAFRGDKMRYNPEEIFVAAISSCHLLWYLHLCAEAGVVVVDYTDNAVGTMAETDNGGGHFTEVTLFPNVVVSDPTMTDKATELHKQAHQLCFIANSCNFPIYCKPQCSSVFKKNDICTGNK